MKEEAIAIHIDPWMHIITTGGGVPIDELLPIQGRFYVAHLEGQEIPDEFSAFQNLQESLKFPEYFGWNWNAVYDCLRDLQWLSVDHHVVIVRSADRALREDNAARDEFFRTLWRAGRRWSYVKRPEGSTLSRFTVVLSCSKDSESDLTNLLQSFQD
ncbi:barstar family protein [Streptomyces sp. NRRL S-118]|uniref:barstar family protein n=1 Tax=Streptomyces sp. NRRL S-118 TaxID=1463881 RepID=UPI00131A9791|nr:barstar family protein [Streptomyces sp. NRRL S-118]